MSVEIMVAPNQPFDIASAKIGDVFVATSLKCSLARVLAFSGGNFDEPNWPARNLHTDTAKAREAGLGAMIVSGTQFEGLLVDLLVDLFGDEAWFSGGVVEARIPKSILVDDIVKPKAVVDSIVQESGKRMYELSVSCENQRGEIVLVGKATCSVRTA